MIFLSNKSKTTQRLPETMNNKMVEISKNLETFQNKIDLNKLSDEELIATFDSFIPKELQHGYYHYRGYTLTTMYEEIQEDIEELPVLDSDIWVTTVPKSGTTWISEMVWSICNDLKSPEAKTPLSERVRFLEYSSLYKFKEDEEEQEEQGEIQRIKTKVPCEVNNSVDKVRKMSTPRIIKTHLPWECLPREIRHFEKRPRVIHIARNPKDVAVSYFYHSQKFRGYSGPTDLFYEMFLRGHMRWAPYNNNVLSYWSKREEPNVLFLRFEDVKTNMCEAIEKIAGFLNISVGNNKMAELLEHLSFENMKRNDDLGIDNIVRYIKEKFLDENDEKSEKSESVGTFLRRGKIGDHREEMTEEMSRKFDKKFTYNSICF